MSLLLQADARALPLPDQYVQTVITSPPYFGLRDYKIGDRGIGLEASPLAFVEALVDVFREVRRVLRDDGTVWLNLGDSYGNDAKWGGSTGGKHVVALHGNTKIGRAKRTTVAKAKDLLGIPWRVALALQAEGWYLRSDIIWSKPNPMPESVRDRPTRSHEYLFLLTKQARYYYDAEAIKEPTVEVRYGAQPRRQRNTGGRTDGYTYGVGGAGFNLGASTRNRRSVWTIAPEPFKGAHFATFPTALVEPCLLAGSADWEHDHPRSVVLDPFCGSGTVGVVARKHGRFFIGCDLNPAYLQMARRRIAGEREAGLSDKQGAGHRRYAGFNERWDQQH